LLCPKLKAGVVVLLLPKLGALLEPNEGAGVGPVPKAGAAAVEPKAGAGVLEALEPKLKPVVL